MEFWYIKNLYKKAQHLDEIRRAAAIPLAKQLTEQVEPLRKL